MNDPRILILADKERWSEAQDLSDALPRSQLLASEKLSELPGIWVHGGFEVVLPLPAVRDGSLQGALEFLGLPYAGSCMTACILAYDGRFLGVPAVGSRVTSDLETWALVSSLVIGPSDTLIEDGALEAMRMLGLSGVSELWFDRTNLDAPVLVRVDTSPSWNKDSSFVTTLERAGTSRETALAMALTSGLQRFRENALLQTHLTELS